MYLGDILAWVSPLVIFLVVVGVGLKVDKVEYERQQQCIQEHTEVIEEETKICVLNGGRRCFSNVKYLYCK